MNKTPIDELDLPGTVLNRLKQANIFYIKELQKKTDQDLLKLIGFGEKSLNLVRKALATWMINIGTHLSDLQTVADGIKKLPREEAREVSLCLLNLLMVVALESEESERLKFLATIRNYILRGDGD